MPLVDTHAHIYLEQFTHDREAMLKRAVAMGVERILLPAIDNETHQTLLETATMKIDRLSIEAMMGVHPCSIKENYKEELDIALRLLNSEQNFIAIGEIGLDFYWDTTFKKEQYEALQIQTQWAIDRHLPVAIHSRKATYECIEVMKLFKGRAKGVFHCFGGSLEEAREIIKLGFYLGIGGVITYKNAGLREVLQHIPLEHLVLETDAPYLSPVPHRGKRNEPAYTRLVAETLSEIYDCSFAEIGKITTENANRLFPKK
ncbi:MAG: TatD family hydrolase [Chitinophagales bacterium]